MDIGFFFNLKKKVGFTLPKNLKTKIKRPFRVMLRLNRFTWVKLEYCLNYYHK